MKKIISLMLAVLLVLSLCACGGAEDKTEDKTMEGLHVGYARADISPKSPVGLDGYFNSDVRIHTTVMDPLYVTCIAVTDGDETVLLISQDLLYSWDAATEPARQKVSEATGLPIERIMICSTHTHSAPEVVTSEEYTELYQTQLVAAAEAALADRAPATIYGTSVQTEKMNFVRHYLMNDGSYAGDNFGNWGVGIQDYATEKDPEMQLVEFRREGDKKSILLMNFQAHPSMTGGNQETVASADFIGSARITFEKQVDMHFVYFTGTAGNLNTVSRIVADVHDMNYATYGAKLAQYAIDALPNMTKVEGSGITATTVQLDYAVNHEKEDQLQQAQEVVDIWTTSGDRTTGNNKAKEYGLSSVYEAREILQRPSRPATDTMELDAIRIGGIAFVTIPGEVYTDNGLQIKESSPYDLTIIATMANQSRGYFSTEAAWDYGCYETFTAYYAKGAAEAMTEKIISMVKSLEN